MINRSAFTRKIWGIAAVVLVFVATFLATIPALAEETGEATVDSDMWFRVLTLADYNTRVVVAGTGLLGLAAGLVGSFALLRRRALMGDALSHATLPGIGLAFMFATVMGWDGKSLVVLLTGAALSGVLGTLAIVGINALPRIKEDTSLGIVLSVFFGAGIAIMVVAQQMSTGHAAGLESFIYGKTASMLSRDSWLIGATGLFVSLVGLSVFKELKLLCFDEAFTQSLGYSRHLLDLVLMAMIVLVTIIGLQAVGLILMIALLVIPPAAARFWTENMERMSLVAALIGSAAAICGSAASAIFPQLPSGATIVLVCSSFFLISMFFGSRRGTVFRFFRRLALQRRVGRQHLLRALYEQQELQEERGSKLAEQAIPFNNLLKMRSWSPAQLRREIRRAVNDQEVLEFPDQTLRLTAAGMVNAKQLARDHRLWELYLITHADIAASKVDQDADMIEHVLEPATIAKLEQLLAQEELMALPPSPHPLGEAKK
ncbi:MAG: iron chelate uptake ABC transporter family permease subunit [Pirellulaceae bacterium]